MTISSLKDLDKLIQLCQRRGVESIKVDGVELKLGDKPQVRARNARQINRVLPETYIPGGVDENTKIEMPDELTDEQLLMWSAGASNESLA